MEICYSPTFIRMLKGLPVDVCEEAIEKITLSRDVRTHAGQKVHKLKGRLRSR